MFSDILDAIGMIEQFTSGMDFEAVPPNCPFCGGPVENQGQESATITEMTPRPQPEVTVYRVAVCRCTQCGKMVRGTAPGLAADQYGATAHRI